MPGSPNPDRRLLEQFAQDRSQRIVDSNPLALALGMELVNVDNSLGEVALECTPSALFVQGGGVIQGGAIVAMLDFAMAFAALAVIEPGSTAASVNLTTSFLRPAPLGTFRVVGKVDRRGRTLVFATARMFDSDDRLVATGASTLAISPA